MRLAFALLILFGFFAHSSEVPPKFPFPELKSDFKDFASGVSAYGKKYGKGQEVYKNSTLPFAPLDIFANGRIDPKEFHTFRNFAFGYVGGALGANPNTRVDEFYCVTACWDSRIEQMRKSLGQIEKLRDEMLKLKLVRLVSHWRQKDRYRVNNWFYSKDGILKPVPSTEFGFSSSGKWDDLDAKEKVAANELKAGAEPILKGLRKLNLIAIIKGNDDSIIVIADGFADNYWGMFFQPPKSKDPVTPPGDHPILIKPGIWVFRKGGSPTATT